jgi:hypothetical protein
MGDMGDMADMADMVNDYTDNEYLDQCGADRARPRPKCRTCDKPFVWRNVNGRWQQFDYPDTDKFHLCDLGF